MGFIGARHLIEGGIKLKGVYTWEVLKGKINELTSWFDMKKTSSELLQELLNV